MQTTVYTRKPLVVDAIQVTEENIYDVAKWCAGSIFVATNGRTTLEVKVLHPQHANQTKAQPGDWVLRSPQGYKIYSDTAFQKGFDRNEPSETQAEKTPGVVSAKPSVGSPKKSSKIPSKLAMIWPSTRHQSVRSPWWVYAMEWTYILMGIVIAAILINSIRK